MPHRNQAPMQPGKRGTQARPALQLLDLNDELLEAILLHLQQEELQGPSCRLQALL